LLLRARQAAAAVVPGRVDATQSDPFPQPAPDNSSGPLDIEGSGLAPDAIIPLLNLQHYLIPADARYYIKSAGDIVQLCPVRIATF